MALVENTGCPCSGLGFTCPAVAGVSYRFIVIHDSCIMCQ